MASSFRSQAHTMLGAVEGTIASPFIGHPFPGVTTCLPGTRLASGIWCGCAVSECTQGGFIADALRFASGADVALFNSGAIRAGLSSTTVTKEHLLQAYPLTDEVVTISVSGATLLAALEHAVGMLGLADAATNPDGRFVQVSRSLAFELYFITGDATPHVGQVYACRAHEPCATSTAPPPPPLNMSATYSLALPDFLASGGDGFSMFTNSSRAHLGILASDAAAAYLRSASPLATPAAGRHAAARSDLDRARSALQDRRGRHPQRSRCAGGV